MRSPRGHRDAVDGDVLGLGVDAIAEGGQHPVDHDPAVGNELLTRPARSDSGAREHLLDALRSHPFPTRFKRWGRPTRRSD